MDDENRKVDYKPCLISHVMEFGVYLVGNWKPMVCKGVTSLVILDYSQHYGGPDSIIIGES